MTGMKSSWNQKAFQKCGQDLLAQRVYTSRLLGHEPSLVLHGGGNTSVKAVVTNTFKEKEHILYVKGSGWDLATIEKGGFAPVRMEPLLKMARLKKLKDEEMVRLQRAAMTDPYAPNPSVEAILHAIIPYTFVDHTHADAVVTISNSAGGEKRIQDIYGDKMLIIPYVMPGFVLAREIYMRTQGIDWAQYEGMILQHHGVFTFDDDPKRSYEKMITIVDRAERYVNKHTKISSTAKKPADVPCLALAQLRKQVSLQRGAPVVVQIDASHDQVAFSQRKDVASITSRGPLTPDHIIRTKRTPFVFSGHPEKDVAQYAANYRKYFKKHQIKGLTSLDPAPRWGVWPGVGTLAFGTSLKETQIITDIKRHTTRAIDRAEQLGGWQALPQKDLFDMEYWELEQAKLKKAGQAPVFQGKVVCVTGAASGIGKACVNAFAEAGAVVAALDRDLRVETMFDKNVLGLQVDVTDKDALQNAVEMTVRVFGGLDVVVPNAGIFPPSEDIEQLKADTWQKSIDINLTAVQQLISLCTPYLREGIDPAIILMASKNVPAPGAGAAAYSVAKAGVTQLGRVAALELAQDGIRVNMLHPNAVFDTAIWTKDVLAKRAESYGLSVEAYKRNNLLNTEITSEDVAQLVCAIASPVFSKTTGARIPIDGGNERVI